VGGSYYILSEITKILMGNNKFLVLISLKKFKYHEAAIGPGLQNVIENPFWNMEF
jgi:hypothetical protein